MTTDQNGKERRPAGSPASTGGQFAPGTAPGQAQRLTGGAEHDRAEVREMAANRLKRVFDAQRFDEFREHARAINPDATQLRFLAYGRLNAQLLDPMGNPVSDGYLTQDFPGFADLSKSDLLDRADRKSIDGGKQWECTIDLTQQHTPPIDLSPVAATLSNEQLDELEQAIAAARTSRGTSR